MDPKRIKADLRNAGFGNVSDSILQEFMDYLQAQEPSFSRHSTANEAMDSEELHWAHRRAALKQKAASFNQQLSAISQSSQMMSDSHPRRRNSSRDFPDPYPPLREEVYNFGFIRPPTFKASRRRFPIYKSEVCYPPPGFLSQLKESEMQAKEFKIPGQDNRDEMRWRLRQRMVYSHPDYRLAEERDFGPIP